MNNPNATTHKGMTNPYLNPAHPYYSTSYPPPPPKKKTTRLIIEILLVLVLLGGAIASTMYAYAQGYKAGSPSNARQNTNAPRQAGQYPDIPTWVQHNCTKDANGYYTVMFGPGPDGPMTLQCS
jgi:hypothetical protein